MMVKICGITNREDAQAAIGGGASALGFNFYPKSPRFVTEEQAAGILEVVPPGIWKVGVFVNRDAAAVAARLGLDVVQLHGDEPEYPDGIRVWKAVPVDDAFHLSAVEQLPVEAVLLDAPAAQQYGGTGRTFDWSVAAGARKSIILAGGLDAENVRQAIETAQPWGVDACSRIERAPGVKDHAKMAAFLKAAVE